HHQHGARELLQHPGAPSRPLGPSSPRRGNAATAYLMSSAAGGGKRKGRPAWPARRPPRSPPGHSASAFFFPLPRLNRTFVTFSSPPLPSVVTVTVGSVPSSLFSSLVRASLLSGWPPLPLPLPFILRRPPPAKYSVSSVSFSLTTLSSSVFTS